MKKVCQKHDEGDTGDDINRFVRLAIYNDHEKHAFEANTCIEDQLKRASDFLGNLVQILHEKGALTDEEVLKVVEQTWSYEVREIDS
jgi:hypothetical protein